MALATAAVGGTALAAYLDAKYHIRKDVRAILRLRSAEKEVTTAAISKNISLWTKFQQQVDRFPSDHRCIWSRTGTYTWEQTREWALKYAQFFHSQGVRRPELVAFYLQNSDHFVFAHLGTWAVSTAPAMINYNLGGEGLIHCLKLATAKIILVDEESEVRQHIEDVRDRIENELGLKIFILDDALRKHIWSLEAKLPDAALLKQVSPNDPSMLIYTSGTTGLPKACSFPVLRTWVSGGDRVAALGIPTGPGGGTWYDPMPLYHGTGAHVMCMCLTGGVQLAVGKKFKVSTFWEDVRDSEATALVYVGETARYLLAAPPDPRDKDNKVNMMFGNGLRPDVWERFMERFGIEQVCEFFSSTEGVFGLFNFARGPFFINAVGHHGVIMRYLLRNTYIPVRVSAEDGSILRDPTTGFATRASYDEGGEIIVAVPNKEAFVGYKNAPEATAKKFARDVFVKGDLYYRSGDSLRRDDDGRWYFLDRLGDTFRWKSENVSTAEVAIAIGEYPGVLEANVYGVLVPTTEGRAGCAAIIIAPEARSSFNFDKLHAHLKKRLPKYAVPVFLRLVEDQAHTTHNQKQNKVPLRNEGVDPDKIQAGNGPQDRFLWLKPGSGTYVEYAKKDWDALVAGKAKL